MILMDWVEGLNSIGHTRDLELQAECPPWEVFLRDPNPYLRKFRKKTTVNSELLGRQARPGIELGSPHLPALSTEPVQPLV